MPPPFPSAEIHAASDAALYCDLHMHSTCSDGTDAPTRLVELAVAAGLSTIALTDHDTFAGVEEAQATGRTHGVRVISGVEISTEHAGRTVHMLGYGFDRGAATLREKLGEILAGREERNLLIIEKLTALGAPIDYAEVRAESGGLVVGRPHFAAVLMRHGHVSSRQEAFDKYLAQGAAAYVDRLRFSPADSVAMIREAGGVAVMAHPKLFRLAEGEQLEEALRGLVEAGLQGIECYYSLHSEAETAEYLRLAEKYNLVATGGSDYHGVAKPDIALGSGHGNLRVPMECAEKLLAMAGH